MSKSKLKSKSKNIRALKSEFGYFPIFESSSEWKATEELALLEAVELYGFGNWGDIAEYINAYSVIEVKEHFLNYFVDGTIGRLTWSAAKANEMDEAAARGGTLSPSLTQPLSSIAEVTTQEQQFLGFMPKREDFEREYDNEAESLVSMLSINTNDDDELEVDLKLAHIDMFRRRLEERFRRKQVVREYSLVEKFYKLYGNCEELQSQTEVKSENCNNLAKNVDKSKKKLNSTLNKGFNDDKDPNENALKIFSQFHSFADHKLLLDNLQKEKELRVKIKELMRFRRNGITKLSEGLLFETARNKRDKKKENQKKSLANIEENTSFGRKSIMTPAVKRSLGSELSRGSSQMSQNDGNRFRSSSSQGRIGSRESSASDHTDRKGVKEELLTDIDETSSKNVRSGKSPLPDLTLREKSDFLCFPSSRLLSEREKKLCTSLKLKPSQYIALKTLLLKEYCEKRHKGSMHKSSIENIDKYVRRKVQTFMAKSGWIRIS